MEMDSRTTRGSLYGADSLTTLGLIWEGAEALVAVIAFRVVHSPSAAFIAARAALACKAVPVSTVPRLSPAAFTRQAVLWDPPAKAVLFTSTSRAVLANHAAVVVRGEGAARVAVSSAPPRVARHNATGRIARANAPAKTVR